MGTSRGAGCGRCRGPVTGDVMGSESVLTAGRPGFRMQTGLPTH
jgi:hypothetical protein